MLFYSFYFLVVLLLTTPKISFGQQTIVYVKRGDIAELCDNRTTSIYAYEYRSFDGKKNSILEPPKHERLSNPYSTSVLRINNVIESDSGLYKCPQDDTEWQRLQVYVPVQHVYLTNLHSSSRVYNNDFCGIDNTNCLTMVEGESLDIACAADGYPRPALDILIDKNGTMPEIMALAGKHEPPTMINDQFKPSVYETYRINKLTPEHNGKNITCYADMKHIDKNLIVSSTKQLYIEFRPSVIEKSKKIYCGINQTRTINCTVSRANPNYLRYSINGLSQSVVRRTYGDQNDLFFQFDITPTSIEDFHSFNVTANNSIGFDTCTYELIHGGIPDAITQCHIDTYSSNVTITINCLKSYAQGDNEGYACTLFKYNAKNNHKIFEEIARTKSCIFALENFHEPVEFRVAAFNRYGSLPVNTYGYVIQLNQPSLLKETSFFSRRAVIIIGSILGGIILLIFLCCLCGTCHRDQGKFSNKNDSYQKHNETIAHLVPNGNEKRLHPNGTVYDTPAHLGNGKYSQQISSTPTSSAYHQQKLQESSNLNYIDHESVSSSLNSIPPRTRTVNNKFYGHPVIDYQYGPLSPGTMVVPTAKRNFENDEEGGDGMGGAGDESPVYSTTTDVLSESGSFLVPSSSKRNGPPPPKPRYSTLSSVRSPLDNLNNLNKTPLPLPKPRSRSNSRTRLNNPNADNTSGLYDERPISSSDSGIGQSDAVCLSNGDTIRSGLVRPKQDTLQRHYITPSTLQQPTRYQTSTPSNVRGTEC
ncbi:unnamed protein product [Adineta steineri]|uniref:Ig-like domain-containing protein n=1 Tax=Adineta steineri TaxID=433720 RepID=A0A815ALT7_9BILA|nr:unnamed protein product [Adineta steineri]CAF1386299.1 unnamed protein product [Adineta steineri]